MRETEAPAGRDLFQYSERAEAAFRQSRIEKCVQRRQRIVDNICDSDEHQAFVEPALDQHGFTPVADQEALHLLDAVGRHVAVGPGDLHLGGLDRGQAALGRDEIELQRGVQKRSLRGFRRQTLGLGDHFVDVADHVERLFGKVIVLAGDDGLEHLLDGGTHHTALGGIERTVLLGLAGALLAWDYVDRFALSERLWPVARAALLLAALNVALKIGLRRGEGIG